MQINWKLRLRNRATLAALASAAVVFVANVATALGVNLPIGQEQAMALITSLLTVLAALGVVVDPTTAGVGDSDAALSRDEPKGR